jgi:hypothetical protein
MRMPPFPYAVSAPHPKGGVLILIPDYSHGEGRPGFLVWARCQQDTLIIHIGPPGVHRALQENGISDLTLGSMVAQFVTSSGIFGPQEFRDNMIVRSGVGALPSSPEWIRLRDVAGGVDFVAHMKKPYLIAHAKPSGGKEFVWLDEEQTPADIPLLAECLKTKPTYDD